MTVKARPRPVSATVAAKAHQYLTGGRIRIVTAGPDQVVAEASGGRTYTIVGDRLGWRCDCPAWKVCAHIVAVRTVTDRPEA